MSIPLDVNKILGIKTRNPDLTPEAQLLAELYQPGERMSTVDAAGRLVALQAKAPSAFDHIFEEITDREAFWNAVAAEIRRRQPEWWDMTREELREKHPERLVNDSMRLMRGPYYTAFGVSRSYCEWAFLGCLGSLSLRHVMAHAERKGKDLVATLEAKIQEGRVKAGLRPIAL